MNKVVLGNELNHVIDFSRLNEDSIIVDLGAAVGGFVTELRTHTETMNSKIICVECSRKNIEKFNTEGYDNVVLLEKAIGGVDEGTVTFSEFIGQPKGDGNHKYYQWGNTVNKHTDRFANDNSVQVNQYDVPLISIKGLMEDQGIDRIDYLKMDIEGAEYDALFALDQDTADKINQMSFETHNISRNPKLVEHLESLGFTVEKHDKDEYYAYR